MRALIDSALYQLNFLFKTELEIEREGGQGEEEGWRGVGGEKEDVMDISVS